MYLNKIVERSWGYLTKPIKKKDLIIIGGGPAGLTAAIYAARANLDMLLLEDKILGGQVRNSYTIENYPGFKKISGAELADFMQSQAEEVGAVIDEFDVIERVDFSGEDKIIETGEIFENAYECAKSINGNAQDIYRCLYGKTKTHKKYHYEVVV